MAHNHRSRSHGFGSPATGGRGHLDVREALPLRLPFSPVDPSLMRAEMRDVDNVAPAVKAGRSPFDDQVRRKVHDLLSLEDRRRFDPRRSYRTLYGSQARIVRKPLWSYRDQKPLPEREQFARPRITVSCVRRHERRRVIFSLGRAGRGGRRNRPARWSDSSYVVCRRS